MTLSIMTLSTLRNISSLSTLSNILSLSIIIIFNSFPVLLLVVMLSVVILNVVPLAESTLVGEQLLRLHTLWVRSDLVCLAFSVEEKRFKILTLMSGLCYKHCTAVDNIALWEANIQHKDTHVISSTNNNGIAHFE
jgi:hypothetical protein